MRRIVLIALLAGLVLWGQQPAPSAPQSTISLEEVVKLSKAGLSEEIIVAKIKKAGRAFDLTAEEIVELKRSGVTDAVIKVLVDPTQPYTPPPPPAPPAGPATAGVVGVSGPAPPKPPPADPIALKVPPEPGAYFSKDPENVEFSRLELKTLTAAKSASKLTKMLKRGVSGYLAGPSANVHVDGPAPDLYLRLPEKASIEEIALLVMDAKSDRREIDFGPEPYKPVFPVDGVKQYSSAEIDSRLYRLHCEKLEPGQYMLFMLGSGDEKKGILGKGYEFEVRGK